MPLTEQLARVQSWDSIWPLITSKLVNFRSISSGPLAGLYGNGGVNAIPLPNGHGPGAAHPGAVTVTLLPENTSALSGPTLFAKVVLMGGCPVEFAQLGLVDR